MSLEDLENLQRLQARFDLSSNWQRVAHNGFSGAQIYRQRSRNGCPYILKIMSLNSDWIMRATKDERCREACLANVSFARDTSVESPAMGSSQDDGTYAILMTDISANLLSDRSLTNDQLMTILRGMGELHSVVPSSANGVPWCSVEDRLTLLMPDPLKLNAIRIKGDILRGWELFFRYASRDVADLVRFLFEDIQPLVRALETLPSGLVHGDLKLDNIGIEESAVGRRLLLIDWSLGMVAPAAIDLGWFLAVNSRALPTSLEATLEGYSSFSQLDGRVGQRHEALTAVCGILIRGWRKALDAEDGEPSELAWWCERASSACSMF